MGDVVTMRTPTGGRSIIAVERSAADVSLIFRRTMADGDIRQETLVKMTRAQAEAVAREILRGAD